MLREAGLEPADFTWMEKEEAQGNFIVSRLNHREAAYYFQFSWYEVSSWCILCPGRYRSVEYEHPMNWREQEASFHTWVQCLKREIESPDPWLELAKYCVALGPELPDTTVNETISGYEADHIGQWLSELAGRLEQGMRLDPRQSALVRDRFGYLAEAARRQKSRDWLYAALGVCASIAVSLGLDDDGARLLWRQVGDQLGHVIRMPGVERRYSLDESIAGRAQAVNGP